MIRFTMPSVELPKRERIACLRDEFDRFWQSDALQEYLGILQISYDTVEQVADDLRKKFNSRSTGTTSREAQYAQSIGFLEENKQRLYPLFDELGTIRINKPVTDHFTDILVLGGSYGANYDRTKAAEKHISESVRSFNALSCYRFIGKKEIKTEKYISHKETEFGTFCDIFEQLFSLSPEYEDAFESNTNLNLIGNIREYTSGDGMKYRVFACPSSNETRRASTFDTYHYFFEKVTLSDPARLLLVTNNQYCNYQFIPCAISCLQSNEAVDFDIIGCSADDALARPDAYNTTQYNGDILSILDWISIFRKTFPER